MSRLAGFAARVVEAPRPSAKARTLIRDAGADLLGCILAGVDHPYSASVHRSVAGYSGGAPVIGTSDRLAGPFAAMANAVAGHVLDFDDWEEAGNTHPSVVMLPALWALASEKGYTGTEVLDAYAAGFDIIVRLGEALNFSHYNRGWHTTATLGVIGVAAACSRLLGLDEGRTAHALSLAISQASGYTCQFGTAAKPLQAGFAARDGLMAARLAQEGATGHARVLDDPAGFVSLLAGTSLERLDKALATEPGSALLDWGIVLKPYPSCGYTHRLVDCAISLSDRLEVGEVDRIEVSLPDFHYAVLPYDRPETQSEALFSVPFCVATALLRGRLTLDDLGDDARRAPDLVNLIGRIHPVQHAARRPDLNYDPDQPDTLMVVLRSGERLFAESAYPLGAPKNPMSTAAIRDKVRAIAGRRGTGCMEALMRWESSSDLTELFSTLRGDGKGGNA